MTYRNYYAKEMNRELSKELVSINLKKGIEKAVNSASMIAKQIYTNLSNVLESDIKRFPGPDFYEYRLFAGHLEALNKKYSNFSKEQWHNWISQQTRKTCNNHIIKPTVPAVQEELVAFESGSILKNELPMFVSGEGMSRVPFTNDDLKIKLAILLIEESDIKNFSDNRLEGLYNYLATELSKTAENFSKGN